MKGSVKLFIFSYFVYDCVCDCVMYDCVCIMLCVYVLH